ncbi:uncharacterized protein LOC126900925 [Daktulosphaira vitifoliae]|uniref:uncharacterized protein LOC126900925 n=1 Tax=Daktulosphaira vitifoliae TaxID=58002 RepID=UPI0021A9FE93|nr:uncharacterized protein LOC126900925 [Daktulosphaira vitifoliae]
MDTIELLILLWLVILTHCRTISTNQPNFKDYSPNELSLTPVNKGDILSRSYGFSDNSNIAVDYQTQISQTHMPITSTNLAPQQFGDSEHNENRYDLESIDGYENSHKPEVSEKPKKDYEKIKKIKEVSIQTDISLVPKENNQNINPLFQQQGQYPIFMRPMRDVSILVRNPNRPIIIARQIPVQWIPHNRFYPRKLPPMLPKHKPCKPCEPKVHKKHHHTPKKPKKKSKGHCHHHKPKKPHHKKLIYYSPMQQGARDFRERSPSRIIVPNTYDVEENIENDENIDDDKPFKEEIEDDIDHRLDEIGEPYDEEETSESKKKHLRHYKTKT